MLKSLKASLIKKKSFPSLEHIRNNQNLVKNEIKAAKRLRYNVMIFTKTYLLSLFTKTYLL